MPALSLWFVQGERPALLGLYRVQVIRWQRWEVRFFCEDPSAVVTTHKKSGVPALSTLPEITQELDSREGLLRFTVTCYAGALVLNETRKSDPSKKLNPVPVHAPELLYFPSWGPGLLAPVPIPFACAYRLR